MEGAREDINGSDEAIDGFHEAMDRFHEAMNGFDEAIDGSHGAMVTTGWLDRRARGPHCVEEAGHPARERGHGTPRGDDGGGLSGHICQPTGRRWSERASRRRHHEAMEGFHEAVEGFHEAMEGFHEAMEGLHEAMEGLHEAMTGR
jgi:uncharacterized protein YukE